MFSAQKAALPILTAFTIAAGNYSAALAQKHSHHREYLRSSTIIVSQRDAQFVAQERLTDNQRRAIASYHTTVGGAASSVLIPADLLYNAADRDSKKPAYVILLITGTDIGAAVLSVEPLASGYKARANYPLFPVLNTSCVPNCESPLAVSDGGYVGRPKWPNDRTSGMYGNEFANAVDNFERNRGTHPRGFYVPADVISHIEQHGTPYIRAYFLRNAAGDNQVILVPAARNYHVYAGPVWLVSGGGVCPPDCE